MFAEMEELVVTPSLFLTELIDYGYPQTTEIDALKLIILQKGYVNQEKVRVYSTLEVC